MDLVELEAALLHYAMVESAYDKKSLEYTDQTTTSILGFQQSTLDTFLGVQPSMAMLTR
jgi:hypothetical protein